MSRSTCRSNISASGANVKVDINKPHRNSFSSIIPGQATWGVSVTATSTAGTVDTAVGAAPWTMNIGAFNGDGTPKYTSSNPQDFGEGNGSDYPLGPLDLSWTDFNGFNNVNTNEVSDIIDGSHIVTATSISISTSASTTKVLITTCTMWSTQISLAKTYRSRSSDLGRA